MEPLSREYCAPFPKTKEIITENDIHKVLGLSYIPPELRENYGEIEAELGLTTRLF